MFQNAPHVRQSESVVTMMTDVVIALIPIYLMSFFYYGARSLVLGFMGAFFCAAFSAVGKIILREKPGRDLTPVITGLILPLLLPADVPYYVLITACSVAVLVVKLPFGGTGNNIFNPAAVGFASVALCWPNMVFSYPAPMQSIEIFGESTAKIAQSPAYSLALGAVPDYEVLDMILGSVPGPMGATNIFVVAACGIFLMVRKTVNWMTPVSFLVPYAVLSALFPRIGGSPFDALCYELFSGTIVFGAFFMLTEPVTSPKRDFGKIMAGISSAVVVFLFRYFGGLEMGFANALILMNVFSPVFDEICESVLHLYRHKEAIRFTAADLLPKKKTETKPLVQILKKKEKAQPAKDENNAEEPVPEKTEVLAEGKAAASVSLINTSGEELVCKTEEEEVKTEEELSASEEAEEIDLLPEEEKTEEEAVK